MQATLPLLRNAMKTFEMIKLVFLNTMQNKFKVLLTSLGIIVGTATIVLVVAIGEGAKQEAEAQYSGLSADTIYINPDYSQAAANGFDFSKTEKLDYDLMMKIKDENPFINKICIKTDFSKEMRYKTLKEYVMLAGVSDDFQEVFSLVIGDGASFSESDFEDGEKVLILGYTIAEKFFGDASSAVGARVKLGDDTFKVIGVTQRNADGLQGMNYDNTVYMPYQTVIKNKMGGDYLVPQIIAKTDNIKNVKKSMQIVQGSLNYYMQSPKSYIIEDAGSRIDTATKSARTMSMLLISVALIVLTVGGIGIMNVLFVTVKERTKEIGVLKALGSKNSGILLQFLTESVFIGIFGGITGLLVSAVALYFMPYTGMATAPSVQGFVLAFVFAVLTSAAFGFYPAYQASRLKPVDALAYE